MTTEQVRPPIAPKIDVRRNPLSWMAKEFTLFNQVNMIDGALFFDTSIAALALDETSYLVPYLNQGTPQFKQHDNAYVTITRHLPQKHKADDGTEIQGEFGEKDSWPKLSLSNFDMYVYKTPPEGEDIKPEDLVRKITVEQSRSGKSRRIILQGRSSENGPWISANVQFDLDPSKGWEPKANLNSMAIYWTDSDNNQKGITFQPKYDEKKGTLGLDNVCLHRKLAQSQMDQFEDRPVPAEQVPLILKSSVFKTSAHIELVDEQNLILPIPLSVLSKVKFPTTRPVPKLQG